MLGFIIQRLLQASVVMAVMSVIVFVGVYAIGNPIEIVIPPDAPQDIRAETIRRFGLDLPLWQQYFIFLSNLVQGDFGRSFIYNMPVLDLIAGRLPATLELVMISILTATVGGVGLGIYAGYRPDSWLSRLIMALSVLGFSVPSFWVGLILILTFAVNLGWLPAGSRGEVVTVFGVGWSFLTLNGLSHILLPALNLAFFKLAMMIRLARAGTR
ncbi:MAG: ABC transporter permease, partial [Kiloniellaceae bacterium]